MFWGLKKKKNTKHYLGVKENNLEKLYNIEQQINAKDRIISLANIGSVRN